MGIFRGNTVDRRISDATTSLDKLRGRLQDTEIGIADARAIAERIAVEGDDAQLDAAEAKTRVLIDRGVTLRAAMTKLESQIADLERKRAAALDAKLREQTASEVELLAREIVESASAFIGAAERLQAATIRAVPVCPEAIGLNHFCTVAAAEIPAAGELVGRLLRELGASVLRGEGRATLAAPPAAPFVDVLPPVEPKVVLFALRPIKWLDEAGKQRLGGKFQDCELPQRLAAKALRSGACVSLSDPLRRQHGSQGGPVPNAHSAFDLDETPPPEPERPSGELHSAFEVVDRGPPRTFQIVAR
jgi:hypothetical protein